MKDDLIYLEFIRECIAEIREYTGSGSSSFLSDRKTQLAVLRLLQVMAESTQRISPDLREAHPEISWKSIAGLRNVLVHAYMDTDPHRIWEIIEQDIPPFEQQIRTLEQRLREGT
jgi:uncharacterized protein with HEPN domain